MRLLAAATLLSIAALACSSSDSGSSAPSVVGTWKYPSGSTTVFLDLRADKSCSYIIQNATTSTCQVCTYAFGDGVLTLQFAASGGAPAQTSSNKANLPDANSLRLENNGTTQLYTRSDLPAGVATCK